MTSQNLTLNDLKTNYPWFDHRLLQLDIEHKQALFMLCEKVPSIVLHLDKLLKTMTYSGIEQRHCWHVSKKEFELLTMLALPSEDDLFIFTEKLEEEKTLSQLVDINGNPLT